LEPEVLAEFRNEKLLVIKERPWFVDMANFNATRAIKIEGIVTKEEIFLKMPIIMFGMTLICLKFGADNLLRRCVPIDEAKRIIWQCHNSSYRGHFNGEKTTTKILQTGFF